MKTEGVSQKRVMFRNILLASDYSASANLAMPYAAGLARSFGTTLFAMHVREPINCALPPGTVQELELTREMEEHFLVDALRKDFPEVRPHVLHAEGVVWRGVTEAIRKHEIDLVVVGTRGRVGIGKALLGSVAEEILRHAPCPVLTVGPETCHEAGRRGRIASILFATDFGKASLGAAPVAVSLAEEYQAKLTLLHVMEKRKGERNGNALRYGGILRAEIARAGDGGVEAVVRTALCSGLRGSGPGTHGLGKNSGTGAGGGFDRDGSA